MSDADVRSLQVLLFRYLFVYFNIPYPNNRLFITGNALQVGWPPQILFPANLPGTVRTV